MSFKSETGSVIREVLQTAAISLIVFFVIYIFLFQPHRVKGESMVPNFADGELLLTEKISYRFGDPHRGDVIVFGAPGPRRVDFIKRVIGLPGETLVIHDGKITVSGEELFEPYETQETKGNLDVTLGDDEYYVLGDNRASSSDSRSFGPIKRGSVRGKVWFIYFPLFANDEYKGLRIIQPVNYSNVQNEE